MHEQSHFNDVGHQYAHTIEDLKKKTRIGRTRIYQDIKEGKLKVIKVGRRTLALDPDVQSWLQGYRSA